MGTIFIRYRLGNNYFHPINNDSDSILSKIYIIAGEASGDLHASNLMRALLSLDSQLDFRYWGGDEMAKVYGKPVKHIGDLAFMGFVEVVMHLKTILTNISFCKKDILTYQPDVLVLVDYPGFNLRIAKWAKEKGIKVVYYISPQIWAWKQNRVYKIKKVVDKMLVILPFEEAFYDRFDVEATFVGHPLLDAIDNYKSRTEDIDLRKKYHLDDRPIIALLPGSRKQEIKTKLPIMLKSLAEFDDYQWVIAAAPALPTLFYAPFIEGNEKVKLIEGGTYDLLSMATAALVTSGTATLETALFEVPEVVCYKGSAISYQIAKRLIKVDYISLVNLILEREAVKELIQNECNPKQISAALKRIVPNGESYQQVRDDYRALITKLGKGGASLKAGKEILKVIK